MPTCKIHSGHISLNFTRGGGVKSAKFGLDFRQQSPSTHCGIETEQDIGNLQHLAGTSKIYLSYRTETFCPPLP